MKKCNHIYSKSMNQDYPRKCMNCGEPENANAKDLVKTESETMLEKFSDAFKLAEEWKEKAKTIVVTNESHTADMKLARIGRLELFHKRCDIENIRKELVKKVKETVNGKVKEINDTANKLKDLIFPIEEDLDKKENFVKYKEAAKKEQERKEFEAYQEEQRIKTEKQEKANAERKNKLYELGLKWDESSLSFHYQDINIPWSAVVCMSNEEFDKTYSDMKIQKEENELEISKENERIRVENEEIKKKADADKKEQDRILAEEKEKSDLAIAEEKRISDEKIRKLKEKADADKKIADDIAAEEKQKLLDKAAADKIETDRLKSELEEKNTASNTVECPHCHKTFSI